MSDAFCNGDISRGRAAATCKSPWQARRDRRAQVLRTKMRREFVQFMDEALGSPAVTATPRAAATEIDVPQHSLMEESRYNPRLHAARASDPDDSAAELAASKSGPAIERLLTASQNLLLQAAPISSTVPAGVAGSLSASQKLKFLLKWAPAADSSTAPAAPAAADAVEDTIEQPVPELTAASRTAVDEESALNTLLTWAPPAASSSASAAAAAAAASAAAVAATDVGETAMEPPAPALPAALRGATEESALNALLTRALPAESSTAVAATAAAAVPVEDTIGRAVPDLMGASRAASDEEESALNALLTWAPPAASSTAPAEGGTLGGAAVAATAAANAMEGTLERTTPTVRAGHSEESILHGLLIRAAASGTAQEAAAAAAAGALEGAEQQLLPEIAVTLPAAGDEEKQTLKDFHAFNAERLQVPEELNESIAGDASLSDIATDVGTPGTFGPSDGAFSEEASQQMQQQQLQQLPVPTTASLGDTKITALSSMCCDIPATPAPGEIRRDANAIQDCESQHRLQSTFQKPGSIVAYSTSDSIRPYDTLLEASRVSSNDEVLFGDVTPVAPAPSSATSSTNSPSRRSMPSSPNGFRRLQEEAAPVEQLVPPRQSGSLYMRGGVLPPMLLATAGGPAAASSVGEAPSPRSPASSSGALAGPPPEGCGGLKWPANTRRQGAARLESPRVGRQLIAMARHWALHRAHPVSATPVMTYPSGASVDLRVLLPCMTSLINLNVEHRAAMLSMLEAGDHLRSALHTYTAYDKDHSGLLGWSTGEVHEFATKAFRQLGLHPPSREQTHTVFAELDRARTGTLDATDCLCLVDVLVRLTFGLEAKGAIVQNTVLGRLSNRTVAALSAEPACTPITSSACQKPPIALMGNPWAEPLPQQGDQQSLSQMWLPSSASSAAMGAIAPAKVESYSPSHSPARSPARSPTVMRGGLWMAPAPLLSGTASVQPGSPGPARSASRSPGPRRVSRGNIVLGLTTAPVAGVQRQASLSPGPLRSQTPPKSPLAAPRTSEPFKLAANYLNAPRRPSHEEHALRAATPPPCFREAAPHTFVAPQMAPQVAWGSAPLGAASVLGGSALGRREIHYGQAIHSFGTVG